MPRRPQDPNHSCDINIPTTMPGTPITIDASENVRLKVLENRMVPKNMVHLDEIKEYDDLTDDNFLYISDDAGNLYKFPALKFIAADKALDYTVVLPIVAEDETSPLNRVIELERDKFNRPPKELESFHLYIYFNSSATRGAWACTAEITDVAFDADHVVAIVTSAVSLGSAFDRVTVNHETVPVINGTVPIVTKVNGQMLTSEIESKDLVVNLDVSVNRQKLPVIENTIDITRTVNGVKLPVSEAGVISSELYINGEKQTVDSTTGAIDLDIDNRIKRDIDALNVDSVGESGKYIKLIEENKGKIKATTKAFDKDINSSSNDTNVPTSQAVRSYVDDLAKAKIDGEYLSSIEVDNNGKISTKSTAFTDSITDTDVNAPQTKAIKAYADNIVKSTTEALDVAEKGADGHYIKYIKETDGLIEATLQKFDTVIPCDAHPEGTATDNNVPTTLAVKTYVDNHIVEHMDSNITAAQGSYFDHIEITNGKLDETKSTTILFDTDINTNSEKNAPTTQAVKTYVDIETQRATEAEDSIAADLDAERQARIDNEAEELNRATTEEARLQDEIDIINTKIPLAASETNKLADKEFVNSSISTNTADFRGTYNSYTDLRIDFIPTPGVEGKEEADFQAKVVEKLNLLTKESEEAPEPYPIIKGTDNNDYAFVAVPEALTATAKITRYDRYKYVQIIDPQTGKTKEGTTPTWVYEYKVNNSGFTSEQWLAINSKATEEITTNAVSDHNLITSGAPGQVIYKNSAGVNTWRSLNADLVGDETKAGYLKTIKEEDGVITAKSADFSETLKTRAIDVSGITAPTSKAVREFVDGLVANVDDYTEKPTVRGKYIDSIYIDQTTNEIKTQVKSLDTDLTQIVRDSDNNTIHDKAPTSKAIKDYTDKKFESDTFIICNSVAEVNHATIAENDGRFIRYMGVEEGGFKYDYIYKITVSENPSDPEKTGSTTVIKVVTVGNWKKNYLSSDNFTALQFESSNPGGKSVIGSVSSTSGEVFPAGDPYAGEPIYDTDGHSNIKLANTWSGSDNSTESTFYSYTNRTSGNVSNSGRGAGVIIGLSVDGNRRAAKGADYDATNFDKLTTKLYATHTLKFDPRTVKASIKFNVETFAELYSERWSDKLNAANSVNGTVWARYTTDSGVIVKRIYAPTNELTIDTTDLPAGSWSSAAGTWKAAEAPNVARDIEYSLNEILAATVETAGYKQIEIIPVLEAYKDVEATQSGLVYYHVLYYYGWMRFSNLQLKVDEYSGSASPSVKQWLVTPNEVEPKVATSAVITDTTDPAVKRLSINFSDGDRVDFEAGAGKVQNVLLANGDSVVTDQIAQLPDFVKRDEIGGQVGNVITDSTEGYITGWVEL